MDKVTVILGIIVGIAAVFLGYKQLSLEGAIRRARKVCNVPVVAMITNIDEMIDPIDDEIIEITGEERFRGKSLLIGYPQLRYCYDGKEYEVKYRLGIMDILTTDPIIIDGNKLNILINPSKPCEVYIASVIDKWSEYGLIEM